MILSLSVQKKLRPLFIDAMHAAVEGPKLHSVLLVGAKIKDDMLETHDRGYCRKTAQLLQEHGFSLAPDCAISCVNLDQTHEDFLTGTHQADLLVFCYLFNPVAGLGYKNAGDVTISPHHHEPHIWHDAAAAAGAKAIAVFGQAACFSLDKSAFAGPEFTALTNGDYDSAHLLKRQCPTPV